MGQLPLSYNDYHLAAIEL